MAIVPHLKVRCISESIQFYQDVLGFYLDWQDQDDHNQDIAMLSNGDKSISLVASEGFPSESFQSQLTGELMFFEDEIDNLFDEVRQIKHDKTINITIVSEPHETNGLHCFSILDCNGYQLTFAKTAYQDIELTTANFSNTNGRTRFQKSVGVTTPTS